VRSREEKFEKFGYSSEEKCIICDSHDTKSEPRFYYSVCINHFHISPVELQNVVERENDRR